MLSMPRYYKQAVNGVSSVELNGMKCSDVGHSPTNKDMNMEVEEAAALEVVTRCSW
jgi:hypothetical protein